MKTTDRWHNPYFRLIRLHLSLAIAASGLAGFFLRARSLEAGFLPCFAGIFLLSCSASAFNQLQERKWDLLMKRTAERPLPSKRFRPRRALVIALLLGAAGGTVLYSGCSVIAAVLGAVNLFLYGMVYTPLKRRSRYAVFIGAFVGAVPPIIGWTAAGGPVSSPVILAVALFMYLWQIPHFLLLQLRFGKEYAAAGFPALLDPSNGPGSRRIVFLWLTGTSASTLLFPLSGVVSGIVPVTIMIMINGAAILFFYRMLFSAGGVVDFSTGFRSIYLYQVVILVLLAGNCFSPLI